MLLSTVNLYYYQDLMHGMRTAIAAHRFADFCAETRQGWAAGDLAPL
jgi:queuine tRNA-ribosyltransferase